MYDPDQDKDGEAWRTLEIIGALLFVTGPEALMKMTMRIHLTCSKDIALMKENSVRWQILADTFI